ncbi:MAG: hypothetical protein AMJ90_02140 [candidate division Zixibacteria bacterium SM23_73_2]|nr:MAG: hypothetical protein AMJ90_02140 [candidate division Zixibacteria bacterium SM23_73_2]
MAKKSFGKKKKSEKDTRRVLPGTGGYFKFLPVVLFALLSVILFHQFIFSDQMLFGTDTIEAGVMFRDFYKSFVNQYHAIPLWNPYLFGGMPFVDAMHGDTFYPLAFIQFFLPLHKALGWKLVLTVFLTGLFTYLCLRAFGFDRGISTLGGLAYMFSANLVSWVYGGQDGRMYITCLLPLLFFFLEKSLNTKRFIYYLGLGMAIGLLILANHPQLAYYALWAVGLYFIFRLVLHYKDQKEKSFAQRIKPLVKPVLLFVFAVFIGLALSLIQLLPPYIYVNKYSPRAEGARGYDYATSWSSHPEELVSQVVPEFCGYTVQQENTYWGRNPFKLNSDYGGIVFLFFAFLSLFVIKSRKKYFFLGLVLLALIYSLGAHTPIYRLFYWLVPQVKNFRAPSLIFFLFNFSAVFLGCLGLERILNDKKTKEDQKIIFNFLKVAVIIFALLAILFSIGGKALLSIWNTVLYPDISLGKKGILSENLTSISGGLWISFILVGLVALAVYLLFRQKLPREAFLVWIGVLLVFDLWRVDFKFIHNYDYHSHFREDFAVKFLKGDPEPSRTLVIPGTYSTNNFLALHRIKQVFGGHGNQLKRYDEFTERYYREDASDQKEYYQRYAEFLFGPKPELLNAKYILSRTELDYPKFEKVSQGDGVVIHKNKGYLPKVRIVHQYEVIGDQKKILERIKEPDFDYKNSVILEEDPHLDLGQEDTLSVTEWGEMVQDKINIMSVKVKLQAPGIVVLSDNFYPAWKAYVDGKEKKIFRANYVFRALALEDGEHMIRFVFDSVPYKVGKTSTLLTTLFLVIIFGFCGFRKIVYGKNS